MFRKSLIRYPVTTREILIEQSLASNKVNKTGKILTRHSPITFISFSPFLQIFYRSLGQRTGGEGSIPANYAAVFEKWSVRLAWVFDPTHRPIQAAWANLRISSTRVRRTVIYLREDRFQKRGPRVMNERAEQVWGARPPIQASSRTRSRKGKKLASSMNTRAKKWYGFEIGPKPQIVHLRPWCCAPLSRANGGNCWFCKKYSLNRQVFSSCLDKRYLSSLLSFD